MNLRALLIIGGIIIAALGVLAFSLTRDGAILNAGLTLGGIFAICGLFSLNWPFHGLIAATVTAMVGLAGNLVSAKDLLVDLTTAATLQPQTAAGAGFAAVSLVLLVASLRGVQRFRTSHRIKQQGRNQQTPHGDS
jgi:hypothetical protein